MPDAVDTFVCAPDDGWWYHPEHVEQFPDKINCVTLHLVGYILEYSYDARTHKRQIHQVFKIVVAACSSIVRGDSLPLQKMKLLDRTQSNSFPTPQTNVHIVYFQYYGLHNRPLLYDIVPVNVFEFCILYAVCVSSICEDFFIKIQLMHSL